MKTAILGAGVSGLALARYLIEGGHDPGDVVIFEAAPKPGGLCESKTVDGFTYDTSGGHILFSKDAEAMQWMKDSSGGESTYAKRDRNTKIRFGDRWVHYPFENGLGDLPEQANFDCLKGYVEAWHQRKANGTVAPGDFGSWVRWRFGDGIAEHFMDPYNEKIWKRDLKDITSGWVAGRVPDAPIEDVLRASIGIRTEGYTHQAIFYYPKTGGFQHVTDGLAANLGGVELRLSTPVTSVRRTGETWKVNEEEFDAVVNTIPMNLVPDFVEDVPKDVADAMRGLAYNSITTYLLALDRAEHPNLSWVYLPQREQGPANRITYMSNYADANAPEGKTSFLCEVTNKPDQRCEAGTLDEVIRGMEWSGLVSKDEILFTDESWHRFAYIVYDHHLEARRNASLEWCEKAGIVALGRFGHYDYHNSDQCVIAAREAAGRLREVAARG